MTEIERFWQKTKIMNGCVEWVGCIHRDSGYGLFRDRFGKTARAHRLIYIRAFGAIPSHVDVMHSCDNRRCVALQHLSPGSRSHNMRDAVRKGRIAVGARHGNVKLTADQVVEIRQRHALGETCALLATIFGVCSQQIGLIVRRKNWRHI